MKRRFPAVVATTALVLACAATPPERMPLPQVDEVLPPPAECSFLIGDPLGVLVEEVIPDSAADGLLLAGDVIVAVEGEPTPHTAALVGVLEEREPGEVVEIDHLRQDRETATTITLGANPDDPDRAMIGVMIRTQYQTVPAVEVKTPLAPSRTSRPISVEGTIYLLDPLLAAWEQTDASVSEDLNWVATSSGLYSLEGETVIELLTGEEIPHDRFEDWGPIRIIGSVAADLLMAVTQPVPTEPGLLTVGISRFDPTAGETVWVEPVLDGFGVPLSALSSPDAEIIVMVGVSEGSTEITSVVLLDGEGSNLGLEEIASLGTPVGWMDDRTLLFRTDVDLATRFAVETGESVEVTLDPQVAGLPLYPVGDGRSVLAIDGQSLVIEDLEDAGEVRVLAEDCAFGRVGEPGWGV